MGKDSKRTKKVFLNLSEPRRRSLFEIISKKDSPDKELQEKQEKANPNLDMFKS